MTKPLQTYHARMLRVLDHIDRTLDDTPGLDELSQVAAFSKFHFHRQFSAIFGLSVHRYAQLMRLKRASYRLAYRDDETVTGISLDAGYESPDAFARAFRQRFGQSPTQFRNSPEWEKWETAIKPLDQARRTVMQPIFTQADVEIREVSETPIAIMDHFGPPARIGETIKRFIAWRKATGLTPSKAPTFNIFHSDPQTTPPEAFHLSLCVGLGRIAGDLGDEVSLGHLPAGRCAVLRVVGNTEDLEPAALFLYRDWLPVSGEELGDFPLYCQRLAFFPDVPTHEAVAELYLPLKERA